MRARHQVRVLDNLTTGKMENLKGVLPKIQFIREDLRDPVALKKAIRRCEIIFHQAALRSVPDSVDHPQKYHEVNVTATLGLLLLAHQAGVRRVVYASSSSIYGKAPIPQKEEMLPLPQSPYAASKLAAEDYCRMFSRLHGLETVGLRYFNVFGPRQSLDSEYAVVIPKFITCLLKGQPPPIHGGGTQTRDFTYVENVIQANLKAALAPRASGQVFNIACGSRYSIAELVRMLTQLLGVRVHPRHTPPRLGDLPHSLADIRKARRILGYRVVVPFQEGLARTAAWFDCNRQAWQPR